MEFPQIGTHCAEFSCKQLDFLPTTCDACNKIYCADHVRYASHNCPEAYKKDNQVPVCPLCKKPIPLLPGENADQKVGQHIDTDCQSDPAKERRGKVYTNRCGVKGCKKRELVPMTCDKCRENYCIRHRHETDHECHGFEASGRAMSSSGAAAISRTSASRPSQPRQPQKTTLHNFGQELDAARRSRAQASGQTSYSDGIQNGMTEDEALARALALSMELSGASGGPHSARGQPTPDTCPNKPLSAQEREDLELARALQASELEQRRPAQRRPAQRSRSQNDKSSCHLS